MIDQATLWGGETAEDFRLSIVGRNFGLVRHGLSLDQIDEASAAHAKFTDNLPDPPLELVEAMIPAGRDAIIIADKLDILDYDQDDPRKYKWHKYRTNYPEFAKPGGYTNRSLQTEALFKIRGITVLDDPKEYYHYHPNSTERMEEIHKERGWGYLPPEVHELHAKLDRIHAAGVEVVRFAYSALEDTHPELLSKHFGPEDIQSSPLRLVIYHKKKSQPLTFKNNPDKILAGPHTDKAEFTAQIAESHIGLWLGDSGESGIDRDPEEYLIDRDPEFSVVFSGKSFRKQNSYPTSPIEPGWHGVKNVPEACRGRQLHGKNAARTAMIFFANSIAAGTILDKSETHTKPVPLSHENTEAVA